MINEKRKSELDALAAQIDEIAQSTDELLETEESMHADYCQSFGYGDGEPDLRDLTDEIAPKVKALKKATGKDFKSELASVCNLEFTGIYTRSNEVYSVIIGEYEDQLPEEIAAQARAMSDEEKEYLRCQISNACLGYSCPDCIYINKDYDRWALVVDEDRLDERLTELNVEIEQTA